MQNVQIIEIHTKLWGIRSRMINYEKIIVFPFDGVPKNNDPANKLLMQSFRNTQIQAFTYRKYPNLVRTKK